MRKLRLTTVVFYIVILALLFSWIFGLFGKRVDDIPRSEIVSMLQDGQVKRFVVKGENIYLWLHTPYEGKKELVTKIADPEGFLQNVQRLPNRVRFDFVNDTFKSYLTDIGVWLELYTYLLLRDTGLFREIYMSVRVGWGDRADEYKGTAYNELDVVACNGLETIFISCKTSSPTPEDFNEIQVYAKKFGGRFGKAVLCTSHELGHGFVGMHTRAKDLGAAIIDRSDLRDGRAVRVLQDLMQVK